MPPNHSQNARKSTKQEGRVLLALEAIQNKQIPSVTAIATKFNIPRSTLYHHLTGTTNQSKTRANNHKLSEIEEQSLVQWVVSIDTQGAPPQQSHVEVIANLLLTKQGSTPP